ncbi:MAG: type II toxin-antitoxin system ParD family antitoxin [Ramlibacter sp.]|nr:type II toxin-antitoxin system ParD family antitoxin [Ramlibacter sp.]
MPTSVALSPHFESFVREQVGSGRYNNVSEVVRAGLRLLEDSELQQAMQLQALRTDIAAGRASGPARPAEAAFDRLQGKYAQQAKRKSR